MARSPMAALDRRKRAKGALPSASEVVAFIRDSPTAVGNREIARAFNLESADRPALRDMLRQIERSGARRPRRQSPLDAAGRRCPR